MILSSFNTARVYHYKNFDFLKKIKPSKSGEIQLTDALLALAKQGKVIAYKFKRRRFDCGSVEGFVEATNHFAKKLGINH